MHNCKILQILLYVAFKNKLWHQIRLDVNDTSVSGFAYETLTKLYFKILIRRNDVIAGVSSRS